MLPASIVWESMAYVAWHFIDWADLHSVSIHHHVGVSDHHDRQLCAAAATQGSVSSCAHSGA
jgi:hypothetical protein